MIANLKILVIDDNPNDRLLVRKEIENNFPEPIITEINNLDKFQELIQVQNFDIVITDYQLQWSTGTYILDQIKSRYPDCPVIMYTATGSEEVAVEAMKKGLDDYILKSVKHIKRLSPSMISAIDKRHNEVELRETQRNLRTSEEKYRSIVTSVVDGIITINRDGLIRDINKAALQIFGYEPWEIINEDLEKIMPKPYFSLHQHGINEYQQKGQKKMIGNTVEVQAVNKKGIEFPIELTVSEVFIGDKIHFTAIIKDISEKKRIENEILKLHHAIEQSMNMVIITDVKDNIEYVNSEFLNVTGYSTEELIGENIKIIRSDLMSEENYGIIWAIISSGEKWVGKFKNRKKNGDYYWVSSTITPVIDSDGQIINYLAIQKDITEDLKRDELMRQSQKMETIGRLVGGITHDFKNIMSVISMSADYLLMELPDDEIIKSEVLEIQESIKLANSITQQLLTFSKDQQKDFVIFNSHEVLSKLQTWLNRLIGGKIKLSYIVNNKDLNIYANPSMLEQIMINLITNSKDAISEQGEIRVVLDKVNITNSEFLCAECQTKMGHKFTELYLNQKIENGEYLNLHVKDNGMGMDEETMKKMFEPFFTTKKPGKGTGLGLSTVYGIVNDFSGHIGVASKVNEGTTFHILIPIVK